MMRLIVALTLLLVFAGSVKAGETSCDTQHVVIYGEPYRCRTCCTTLHIRWDGVLDRFRCGMRCRLDPWFAPEATPHAPETER
jgi:hypothetical protein